ncbi:MAG TPA: serine/threonine-protein kinase [Bryobacteraceae bacterium]|nr:serine/threonine-protein kinase [Bryobacteraceae bacterium]
MAKCPSCATEIAENSRFCSACGKAVELDVFATQTVASVSPATPRVSPRPASGASSMSRVTSSRTESRFPPGTVLAGRYRIVSMLGKGGMGEVYRADDLTLDQPVALKFLPESLSGHEGSLARFKNEVRVARQVSHPNVCRVYDVGEIDGQLFLSMEYVDGEDLGSLLRRIGRLPVDKALEISRKLCAGLAAAHEKGVLHRDLKPSNVMLDSQGQVLLTDFGLAGLADQLTGAEVRNGTPQYMAPEQLAGREVTARSDIYSLGLVLYEIFSGKRPFEAKSMAELMRIQTDSRPESLTTLVRDIDPSVERVILRCLDPEPARRPTSALAVAAALPGGDPLAAALAAGETPSPEMVAAAGEGVGLSPRFAITLMAAVLLGLAAYFLIGVRLSALEQIRPPYSPEILTQKAREMVQRFGVTAQPADEAYGFKWDGSYLDYAETNDKPTPRWNEILSHRPVPLKFWYRQSPYPLTAGEFHDDLLTPGVVAPDDPPLILTGMINMELDAQGNLLAFERIPAQKQRPAQNEAPIDWTPLFTAAGLDQAQFQTTEPLWTWRATSDTRAAWTGTWPGSTRPLRVEAAALRGRAVAFSLIGPWTSADRMPARSLSSNERGQFAIFVAISLAVGFGCWALVRRNAKSGRGDEAGATRLAGFVGMVQMILWAARSHMNPAMGTFGMLLLALATAVFYGFVVRTMYIALEPHVRRRWPQTIISSTAVLTSHWRDPIVGRDLLIGCALGVLIRAILAGVRLAPGHGPQFGSTYVLSGFRSALTVLSTSIPHGIRETLMFFLIIFLLRVLLRNQWLACAGFTLLFTALNYFQSGRTVETLITSVGVYALISFVVLRFGLLAMAIYIFVDGVLGQAQPTLQTSSWYFVNSIFLFACVLAMAGWGFRTSIAGRKLWKQDLLA